MLQIPIPVVTLSSGLASIVTIRAESSRLYQLSIIDRINIISNTFPVTKDTQLGDRPSFALTSFTINPDEIQDATFATFSFTGGMSNNRRYRLNGQSPINQINISFQIQYIDGSVEDILVLPTETFNLFITFNKVL